LSFWPLAFNNVRLYFLASYVLRPAVKTAAANRLNEALLAVWTGFEIENRFPLHAIAKVQEYVENQMGGGRVILTMD
jgi:hypothetical protein